MHFKSGCANPGQVLSVDPPLLATFTDLTKGDGSWPVIKITKAPLARLCTSKPRTGQTLATVALYRDDFPDGEHWGSFDPKPVAAVTNSNTEIERLLASFDDSDLTQMRQGIDALPQNAGPGYYRVYPQSMFEKQTVSVQTEKIRHLLRTHLKHREHVSLFDAIDTESRAQIAHFVPANRVDGIFAIVRASHLTNREAIAFDQTGIYYFINDDLNGWFDYDSIAGALSTETGLEITLRSRQRLVVSGKRFSDELLGELDGLFDAIAASGTVELSGSDTPVYH